VDEIKRAADDMTDAEVAAAAAQMKAGMLMGLESPSSRTERLARMISIWGRVPSVEEQIAKMEAVTTRNVRDFAGRMAGGTGLALALYGPAEAAPTLEAVRERLAA
jgi:predicted Zn-dependent peptidase